MGEAVPATNRLVQPPLELLLRPNDGQPARGHVEPPNEGQGRAVVVALASSVEPERDEEPLEVYPPPLDGHRQPELPRLVQCVLDKDGRVVALATRTGRRKSHRVADLLTLSL